MEQHLLSLSSSHHFWNPLLSNEGIKKRFARAMFAFRAFPGPSRRWPSSHRALALISITPPFVLIEYLLAYLLLITEAAAAAPSHRCTQLARPLLNAQLNPRRSLPPAICGWAGRWVCKCQSLAAERWGVSPSVTRSVRWIAGGSTRRSISGWIHLSVSHWFQAVNRAIVERLPSWKQEMNMGLEEQGADVFQGPVCNIWPKLWWLYDGYIDKKLNILSINTLIKVYTVVQKN